MTKHMAQGWLNFSSESFLSILFINNREEFRTKGKLEDMHSTVWFFFFEVHQHRQHPPLALFRFYLMELLLPQPSSTEYDDARQRYTDAMHTLGYQADLAYNIALCYFKDKQYAPALKHVGELLLVVPRRALEEQDSRYEVGRPMSANN